MRRLGLFVIALAVFAVGETLVAQRGDWPSTRAVKALETIFDAEGNLTTFIFTGANPSLIYNDADALILRDAGSDHVFTLQDVPDLTGSDSTVAMVTTSFTPGIIDAGDTLQGLKIDISGTANHTGGDVVALEITNQTNDGQSANYGIRIADTFDTEIAFLGTVTSMTYLNGGNFTIQDQGAGAKFTLRDIPVAGTANDLMELDVTLSIMDGSDTFRGIVANITNADHTSTSNLLYGIAAHNSLADDQAYESAFYADTDWDAQLTLAVLDVIPANDPPAGHVAIYLDDNSDYSGGGGNDCVLMVSDTNGANTILATINLNGACP